VSVTEASAVDANDALGIIDTRGVTGQPTADATSTVTGTVVGKPFVQVP
jgi:hypothetical protein